MCEADVWNSSLSTCFVLLFRNTHHTESCTKADLLWWGSLWAFPEILTQLCHSFKRTQFGVEITAWIQNKQWMPHAYEFPEVSVVFIYSTLYWSIFTVTLQQLKIWLCAHLWCFRALCCVYIGVPFCDRSQHGSWKEPFYDKSSFKFSAMRTSKKREWTPNSSTVYTVCTMK